MVETVKTDVGKKDLQYLRYSINIINNRKYAVALLLDMSKAYYTISYKILLRKVYGICVRGIAHIWFVSYLENREQFVDIEHTDFYKKNYLFADHKN